MEKLKCNDITYNTHAQKILSKIFAFLEKQPFQNDIDEKDGVLSYKVTGIGEYVLNKQPPLQQIWSSSPITGPKRFYIGSNLKWYATKTNEEIIDYFNKEVEKIKHKK